jgi:hypothetical protein
MNVRKRGAEEKFGPKRGGCTGRFQKTEWSPNMELVSGLVYPCSSSKTMCCLAVTASADAQYHSTQQTTVGRNFVMGASCPVILFAEGFGESLLGNFQSD